MIFFFFGEHITETTAPSQPNRLNVSRPRWPMRQTLRQLSWLGAGATGSIQYFSICLENVKSFQKKRGAWT